MSGLFDHIDRSTFEAALQRLGVTPEQFRAMTGPDFATVIEGYVAECSAYVARVRSRDDQVQAAARLCESIPEGCNGVPLYELSQRGLIDQGEFIAAMNTVVRVQAEDEADPNPADDNVMALLDAFAAMAGDAG
jgi:hypothetical protein